jgi:membrane protein DedA with SNARE-associated domain
MLGYLLGDNWEHIVDLVSRYSLWLAVSAEVVTGIVMVLRKWRMPRLARVAEDSKQCEQVRSGCHR